MERDHTKLICDVGELIGLFSDATSLETFLQRIVGMISDHMRSEVCSIYLYSEDTQELVLKATKGLKQEAVGRVRLKLGEGLTGMAVKELRPVCVKNASKQPVYKYFPDIGEESYESFLAVPIVHGQSRIGAVVIQNSRRNYFTEEDVRVFRAITSQLAMTIETAKLLIEVNETQRTAGKPAEHSELKFVKGRVGSAGFALGPAVIFDHRPEALPSGDTERIFSLEDFYRAATAAERELEQLQAQIEETLSDVASLIFAAQILMLKDKPFIDAITGRIQGGENPPAAIAQVVRDYAAMFDRLPNQYLREKKHDVLDIGERLLENLTGGGDHRRDFQDKVVIARELFPSAILKLSSRKIKGVVLLSGGITSHVSILARSLRVPLVIVDQPALLHIVEGTPVLMDAEVGNVYVNPSADVLASFRQREEQRAQLAALKERIEGETFTRDGERIKLLSNINLLSDIKAAREYRAEGVGLYRTEFPFIVRTNFPTEEEQYLIYKKLVDGMEGKEIVFRTLDIGGDKVLSYYDYENEKNPYLGMRSIRFSLRHKDIFVQQIRAILRAGAGADVAIMFPMISSLDEFAEARAIVLDCIKALRREKTACHKKPKIGIMVELPSALEIIDELAEAADFFSIGTNDFIQYMLAVDRTNEKVADLYLPHHPAILRALKKVASAARDHQKDVSICGDMAQDERFTAYFLGIGIRKFSVDSHSIPKIQRTIQGIDLKEAAALIEDLVSRKRISETTRVLGKRSGKQ